MYNKQNGRYKVENKILHNKFYALMEASRTARKEISWWYYDEIFESACQSFRSYDMNIADLYKQRALQLREKYDYLILNYSAGSDSHNILQTFLKNNIKLDMVYTQWPVALMDKGLYTPNKIDKTNFNFMSEWDYAIKGDLEWLSKNRPEIRIEIGDWTTTVTDKFYNDDLLLNNVTNLPSIARGQKQNTFSKIEGELANKGLRVGTIYGVDKTMIMYHNNELFFRLSDIACMSQPNPENPEGLEYFYWTPDMPQIPILQSYKMLDHLKKHPHLHHLMQHPDIRRKAYSVPQDWVKDFNEYSEIFKFVCYPHWDFSRFQADKPLAQEHLGLPMGVRAHDGILMKGLADQFKRTQQQWEYMWKSYKPLIDPKFLRTKDTVFAIWSKWHKVVI